ncbi:MAG TPA: LysM peptidoglycan-binding domain-containing protein [Anaerolineae bacterium]|nr:LysM peptidoglycan-binding domain-containing protein [Anaerolineae bacterium]
MKGKIWKKTMLLVVCLLVAQLVIGATTAAAAPPAYGPIYHCVRYGETLSSIGRLYGVNPYAIARANGLANPNYIYVGQVLLIPTGYYPCYYPCGYYCYPSCYPYYYCWPSCYFDP